MLVFSVVSICFAWGFLIHESLHHSTASPIAHIQNKEKLNLEVIATSPPVAVVVPVATSKPVVSTVPGISPRNSVSLCRFDYRFFIVIQQKKELEFNEIHFIHIPKCGGTSMSAVLRQVMCQKDPSANTECCTNPGFCDWHAHRRCPVIKGCINHFPHRPLIFKPLPSIAIFRHPVSRLISAFFYRCHSPNSDCFQVRPESKLIKERKRSKVTFDEYLEMHEYNNIMTRMLGADSFPYRNVTVTEKLYAAAINAVDNIFFVGLQEAYEFSVEILLREFDMKLSIDLPTERQDHNKKLLMDKDAVKSNEAWMRRAEEVNSFDMRLYKYGTFVLFMIVCLDLMISMRISGVTILPVSG